MNNGWQVNRKWLVAVSSFLFVFASFGQAVAQSGTWTTKAPMPTARGALGTGILSGSVYAVGGFNGAPVATVEAYDPATNTWSTKAAISSGRNGIAVAGVNNLIYAIGGSTSSNFAGAVNTVEAYDPGTNSWTGKAAMPTARHHHAVGVVNGIIYAVGGASASGGLLATVEAYDPSTNSWSLKAPLPTPRVFLAVSVINGILYAVGGQDSVGQSGAVEAYDPVANTWTTKAPMLTPRGALATAVVNGKLYALGGNSPVMGGVTTVEVYDPIANTWAVSSPMPTGRDLLAAETVNGTLYAVGGRNSSGFLATVEAFTPFIHVAIDIKPGSDPNSINLSSAGVIPVAILSSGTFDATTVDPETVSLAGAKVRMVGKSGKFLCHQEYVNSDTLVDLVCQVQTVQFIIEPGDSVAVLEGKTTDGTEIRGEDSVKIVP